MRILLIRLSAMGDVAMTVPLIKALREHDEEHQISLITNKIFNPFFSEIEGLQIINPDLKGKHKGILGLYKFFKTLKKDFDPDLFIDLHNVLRSKVLSLFFTFTKTRTFKISKGRKEKKQLTRRNNKKLKELKHTVLRYQETMTKAGIDINLKKSSAKSNIQISQKAKEIIENDEIKIGFAPFAKHFQKQYPLNRTEEVIRLLIEKTYNIYIFGGGKEEQAFAEKLENSSSKITSLVGKFSLEDEIALIDKMDVIITMDSSNMHIAALTNTDIISVWGATHPFAGFTPFTRPDRSLIIQNNKLECRPCSVYGNKACYKGTLECMESIAPEKIVEACENMLETKQP